MVDQLSFAPQRAMDANGKPISGALAYFYKSGTTTPATVYQDTAGTVPHETPVVADASGVFPQIFSGQSVKVNVTTASGASVDGYPVDPAIMVSPYATGASGITFAPTSDIPVTNVQKAIETVQENIVAPLAEFGLGVTGNATILANIDATDTASGFYRFTTGASGTFPSGVSDTDGGTVSITRETASAAYMILVKSGDTASWRREMTGSEWGAWSYLGDAVSDPDMSVSPDDIPTRDAVAGAIAENPAIGVGQSWHDLTSSRSGNTVYTNNTGRPIMVNMVLYGDHDYKAYTTAADGTTWIQVGRATGRGDWHSISIIVPAGAKYKTNGGSVEAWAELR